METRPGTRYVYLVLPRKEFLQETMCEGSICIIWVDVKCQGYDGIPRLPSVFCLFSVPIPFPAAKRGNNLRSQTHASLQVIAFAVLDEIVHDQDAQEEDNGFEALKMQSHVTIHDPAQNHERRSHK